MNDFLSGVIRWTVRLVMLAVGCVFVLSLLTVACVLAVMWGARALWAKLTGRAVTPWVMPMGVAANWASMAQRAGGFGGAKAAAAASAPEENAPFMPAAGSKRGGILSKVAAEVSDVQAREVH